MICSLMEQWIQWVCWVSLKFKCRVFCLVINKQNISKGCSSLLKRTANSRTVQKLILPQRRAIPTAQTCHKIFTTASPLLQRRLSLTCPGKPGEAPWWQKTCKVEVLNKPRLDWADSANPSFNLSCPEWTLGFAFLLSHCNCHCLKKFHV